MKTSCKITFLIVLACLTAAFAQDWPQYLGPNSDSKSPQKGLLRTWPDGGPEILWTVSVNKGYGGPAVKGGKVYLLDRDDEVGDNLRCFDLASGKELWNFAYEAPGSVMFPGSRSVPTVEGNYVYSCGHNGDLYCVDINTHKPIWNANVWADFGGQPGRGQDGFRQGRSAGSFPIWGITQCPLIYDDLVIVLSQAPEAGAVAYNKLTGNIVWKTPNLGSESYASPSVAKIDGEDHIAMVISSTNPIGNRDLPQILGSVIGIEPKTGKVLWNYDKWNCHISVPSAVDAGDNKVLIVGGYELGATMIKVEKKTDGSYSITELFTTEEFGDQTKPPILHNGYFYAQFGTNSTRDGLTCMNMDGEIMWKTKRDPDFNKGSMILADGLILATDGEKSLYLIEPDPSGFKPLASAELLAVPEAGDDPGARRFAKQNWAPIALADGKLLIRDQAQLKCVKVAK